MCGRYTKKSNTSSSSYSEYIRNMETIITKTWLGIHEISSLFVEESKLNQMNLILENIINYNDNIHSFLYSTIFEYLINYIIFINVLYIILTFINHYIYICVLYLN